MDRLRATHTFTIEKITHDPHEARSEIAAGRARVGVVIPPDFHYKRARGEEAKVLVLIDGSDSTVSAQALGAVTGLAAQVSLEEVTRSARLSGITRGTPL